MTNPRTTDPHEASPPALSEYRALSVIQPWATLLVTGAKRIETRSWRPKHRGRIAIHASGKMPAYAVELCSTEPFRSALRNAGITSADQLPLGAIIGGANLRSCVPTDDPELADISDTERAFGNFAEKRYAWMFDAPRQIEPITIKGDLWVWAVPEGVFGDSANA
jgi:hypothetical protein